MLSSFTADAIGVLLLVLFGVFYWLGIMPTTRAVFAAGSSRRVARVRP